MDQNAGTAPGASTSLAGMTAIELDRVGSVVKRLWLAADGRFAALRVPALAFRYRRCLAALGEPLGRLPELRVKPSATPAGSELERLLLGPAGYNPGRHHPSLRARLGTRLLLVPDRRSAMAVLAVPPHPEVYLAGRKRQALRTNLRRAGEHGIVVAEVTDGAAQIESVQRVLDARHDSWLRQHRGWLERAVGTGVVQTFAGHGPDGTVLTVALVVADRPWALLHLCVSVQGEMAAYSRYATHAFMVDALSRSGIRTLLVDSVLDLTPGLRYFQARLGFELMNVTVG